ncbi:5-hydroxytryptamine receptor 3A-like [Pimephales promelas]|uniref:5-hydroxytryptamine receptor 3A-like n=1 Tax=Pimephales promelas TaxID=90988 RepID=UPI00195584AC|nr:5-hydroxytryptamine receptor 3A-like [Pimephales promelas]
MRQQKYLRHFSLLNMMHLHWLMFLLILLGWVFDAQVTGAQNCSDVEYAEARKRLFEHLGMDKNDAQKTRTWPLTFGNNGSSNPADIYMDLYVTSIIKVDEKAQSLTTQVQIRTAWPIGDLEWEEKKFCGIDTFAAPKDMFWTPDIGIVESLKTDFGTKDFPNVVLFSFGFTFSVAILSLTTACKMDLHMFPFDSQSCKITFQSTSYSTQDITINPLSEKDVITVTSQELFLAQGEWDLINITYSSSTYTEWIEMDQLIYQIDIKRRPLLYVINIIVPVFFFLILDVASFFIVKNGYDKLGFKVTLLLSISVMLLILSNTLPSTADRIPLIGVYCCAVFCLIGISLLETIFVNYLKAETANRGSVETTSTVSGQDGGVRDPQNPGATATDPQIISMCNAATQRKPQQKTCLYWTRVARTIDVTFFVLYIITIIVFLSVLGKLWIP